MREPVDGVYPHLRVPCWVSIDRWITDKLLKLAERPWLPPCNLPTHALFLIATIRHSILQGVEALVPMSQKREICLSCDSQLPAKAPVDPPPTSLALTPSLASLSRFFDVDRQERLPSPTANFDQHQEKIL